MDSEIVHSRGGVLLAGPDAIRMARAVMLWSAIGLLGNSSGRIQPTRGFTMKRALDAAAALTGKKYRRTEWEAARADVKKWADEMRAALPHVVVE